MTLAPGGALWLLWHEFRIFLYGLNATLNKGAAGRHMNKRNIAVWCVLTLLLHGIAFAMLLPLNGGGGRTLAPQMAMVATLVLAVLFTLMLSGALKFSVEALFERGDLDLLLSSPISSRSIFTARLAAVAGGVAGLFLFFLAPFANAGLALGQFHWLAIYPSIIGMAAISASVAMLLTLALVRALGVRRTRVVAQVLGALSGTMVFLFSQLFSDAFGSATAGVMARIKPMLAPGRWLGPESWAWLPGQAVLGAPLPLLCLVMAALAMFLLTVRWTHGFFVRGLQQAVSTVRASERPAGELRFHFDTSLTRIVLRKEMRLILRDPQLISQVLLQLLFILPLGGMLIVKGSSALVGMAAGLAFLCGSLAAALAWVTIAAEDAPDLLRAAPCGQGTIRRAKLAAAALPSLALMVPPLLWTGLSQPLASALMFLLAGGASLSAPLIVHWLARPAARGSFNARGKGNVLCTAFELVGNICWAALAYLVLAVATGALAPMPFLFVAGAIAGILAGMLGLGYLLRLRPA
ncbi:hypothetical protein [Massilia glaciei]|uniref:Uncharacterized protein n=1 Tax=Massilia glaciei TaxID=1524097 RepID=A0A2U2HIS2_9BURK|nr:hypothetical protein [Massilia glaciei]PWF46661.1 hypothetical protein C7C56_015970 [Massilia glaciei]